MGMRNIMMVVLLCILFSTASCEMLQDFKNTELDPGRVTHLDFDNVLSNIEKVKKNHDADTTNLDRDSETTVNKVDIATSHQDHNIVPDGNHGENGNELDTTIFNEFEDHIESTDLDLENRHDGQNKRDENIYTEQINKDDLPHLSTKMDPDKVMDTYPGLFHTKEEIDFMNEKTNEDNMLAAFQDLKLEDNDRDNCCPTKTRYKPVQGNRTNVQNTLKMIVYLNKRYQVIPVPDPCKNGTCDQCKLENVIIWLLVHSDVDDDSKLKMKFDAFSVPMYCSCKKLNCIKQ
ncbi:uncharacterized protein LOC117344357 [Pecten maximus]|uniref:uncharacterized protein LOC117344357 n=1 Tax=Pecten maximus TaxID=6579 RepID=UPI0014583039|nr:uncharacterized protein LOC117344357 [Pecten maximus]